jgi:very-long-chain enoyl-CoA reductase
MSYIQLYNFCQVLANVASIGMCMFATDTVLLHLFVKYVECSQMFDIIHAGLRITKSNVATTAIQTIAKSIVVVYGNSTYIRYLGATWAISDLVRYAFYIWPSVKDLRYSQYKVLYPIGIGLEIATIMPVITNPYIKILTGMGYVFFAPKMFNHASILETRQRILTVLEYGRSLNGIYKITYDKTTNTYDENRYSEIRKQFTASRFKWVVTDDMSYVLKDYGIQISWRLVYLIEYFGALVTFPLLTGVYRVDAVLWMIHYSKRLFESAFIHSFSSDTMPLANVFKNSAYYWGAGLVLGYYGREHIIILDVTTYLNIALWVVCQLMNGLCHLYLAGLRSDKTSREHILPTNWLFRLVVCPNYTFEILGWALFATLGYDSFNMYTGVRMAFCCVGAAQMYVWAGGKRRRYKKLFGDKYKVSGTLLPGI